MAKDGGLSNLRLPDSRYHKVRASRGCPLRESRGVDGVPSHSVVISIPVTAFPKTNLSHFSGRGRRPFLAFSTTAVIARVARTVADYGREARLFLGKAPYSRPRDGPSSGLRKAIDTVARLGHYSRAVFSAATVATTDVTQQSIYQRDSLNVRLKRPKAALNVQSHGLAVGVASVVGSNT